MIYRVICCNEYYSVGETNDRAEALAMAQNHEDGTYACIICANGRTIGDCCEGYYSDAEIAEYNRDNGPDHATMTGMYDNW